MVLLGLILTIVVFMAADYFVRTWIQHSHEQRKRRERAEVLTTSLELNFADEAKSLKRVEVPEPKARILAVDDESIVLDSFRRILVLAGYSVDTVEHGPEALTLLQQHDRYDFLFTDLKMPDMEGVEVVKAAKHVRPDVDIIVITGFATVETAVETMKTGAMDYIQKPFMDDELVKLVDAFVIRREERIARESKPQVHLVTPSDKASHSAQQFNVLSGVFISSAHAWLSIEATGAVRVGVDDFAQKILGPIDGIDLPHERQQVRRGERLCVLKRGAEQVEILSPVSGKVVSTNYSLGATPKLLNANPYESAWICRIEPDNLPGDLVNLRMGATAVSWYQKEIDRYFQMKQTDALGGWQDFARSFLQG